MKKILLAVTCMFFITCCTVKKDDNGFVIRDGIQTLTQKGCEYVVVACGHGVSIVHAGNCKNPEHNEKDN